MPLLFDIAKPMHDEYLKHLSHMCKAATILQEEGLQEVLIRDMVVGIGQASAVCHTLSVLAGWWTDTPPSDLLVFATKIALIHSEISEALEGGRKGLPDDHLPWRRAEEVELADALIRIFDLAGARKLDLAGAVIEKLAYNKKRADHTRKARQADGGKKF